MKEIVLGMVLLGMSTGGSVIRANENHPVQAIAHALGQVDGHIETNAKEAFLESANKGYTLIEADFQMTSDGELVVRHDFGRNSYSVLEQEVLGDYVMTLEAYQNQKIKHKYTPLTAKDLFELMDAYPDVYIITDTKNSEASLVRKDFEALVDDANELGKAYLLDRLIIQLYNKEMYDVVEAIYPFKDYIVTMYQLAPSQEEEMAKFCVEKGIKAIATPYDRLNKKSMSIFDHYGLDVYTHTLNKLEDVKKSIEMGVEGIYTDVLTAEDFSKIVAGKGIDVVLEEGQEVDTSGENQPVKNPGTVLQDYIKYNYLKRGIY